MPDIKRTVKIVTEQQVIDKPSVMEGFPMRKWSTKIFLLDDHGDETSARIFSSVEFLLHDSFGDRARQVKTEPPFRISEEGWGEFEMRINLFTIDNGKEHSFVHDLNFATPRYDIKHVVAFKKPTPTQIAALRLSGPIPGDHQQDGSRKKPMIGVEDIPSSMGTPGGGGIVGGAVGVIGGSGGGLMTPSAASGVSTGKKRKSGLAGRDKLEILERLAEEIKQIKDKDMYELIEIINDNKTEESLITNDLDNGEFTVDLCTLPDRAVTLLQQYVDDLLTR